MTVRDCGTAGSRLYAYNAKGCRCSACVDAIHLYQKAWRAATGSERRVGPRGDQKRAYDRRRAAARKAAQ